MSSFVDNSINSAIVSGYVGLQNASQGITQASQNIALRSAQQNMAENGPEGVLASASQRNLENVREMLPQPANNLTSDILSLQNNSINAQASAKVLDTAFDTVGTIIDTLA
ncbi:hypothetical protein [Alteromonas halophila]|uniref:Flagellar biosynthesis protein FlgE n=1 Tax=Alteromonas halophila TaxID=516698 RepID=A0A918JPA4_9ALTE|nr:hypothetical protein [Alteromonas halophila]GGW90929.1 hypothetical protein GCM10007391_26550 [Alteromonas halophila]